MTKFNKRCLQGASIFIIILGLASATLIVIPVNADDHVDQSLQKWTEKCDKATDKGSQDAARKADRQYDQHAPEGPLVQCVV